MKSMLRIVVVGLLLGLGLLVGRSSSQTRTKPEPRTRVALINLAQVFKGYAKVTHYTNANKVMLQPFQDKVKDLQQKIAGFNEELEKKDLPDEKKILIEKKRTARQRELEDLQVEAKQMFTRKNEEQMLVVYKEVAEVAQQYARAHGIDLVVHYNDVPTDSPDYFSAGNVSRKIQAGAFIPLYIGEQMEITREIIATLNDAFRQEKVGKEARKP